MGLYKNVDSATLQTCYVYTLQPKLTEYPLLKYKPQNLSCVLLTSNT